MTYVLDTNIITAIMKGNEAVESKVEDVLLEGIDVFINCISYYEIKRGLLAANAISKLANFEYLCKEFGLIFLDDIAIFDEASKIYSYLKKRGRKVKGEKGPVSNETMT